jgi:hypothetical protein
MSKAYLSYIRRLLDELLAILNYPVTVVSDPGSTSLSN